MEANHGKRGNEEEAGKGARPGYGDGIRELGAGSVEHAEEGTRSLQSTGGEPDEQ